MLDGIRSADVGSAGILPDNDSTMRWVVLLILFVLVGGVVGLLAWSLGNKEPVTGKSSETRIGKPALEISLKTFEGTDFLLSEHWGSPIVLNFWASWCLPCRDEAPALRELWQEWSDDGLVVIGVNSQDGFDDAEAFIREFDVPYVNVIDTDGKASIDYGVVGLPVTLFIGKDGTVEHRYVGALRAEVVEAWIEDLVAAPAVEGSSRLLGR